MGTTDRDYRAKEEVLAAYRSYTVGQGLDPVIPTYCWDDACYASAVIRDTVHEFVSYGRGEVTIKKSVLETIKL